ncbi:MAG TPA: hypothetical protein VJK05_01580 [archaeon]|nr:hypothetical protein [archaeon]
MKKKSEAFPLALLFVQFVSAVLFILIFFGRIALIDFNSMTFSFSDDGFHFFAAASFLAVLLVIEFSLKKKDKHLKEINDWLYNLFKYKAGEKKDIAKMSFKGLLYSFFFGLSLFLKSLIHIYFNLMFFLTGKSKKYSKLREESRKKKEKVQGNLFVFIQGSRTLMLMLIELIFAVLITLILFVLLEDRFEIIKEGAPFYAKPLIVLVIFVFILYAYNLTSGYRKEI